MGLKPGYKQTEAGIIPEDWETQPLGKVALVERGKFSARPRNAPKFFGGGIPFIQTGDVTNSDGKIESYSQNLNAQGLIVSKLFPANTLFFTIAANIGDVGICAFATACPDSLVSITPKAKIDKKWLFHTLRSQKKKFEGLATQNAQLNINLEKLNPFVLAIPPLPEQRAIAAALSDTDSLLSSLDQLLAKKRDIKQAVMQQLLTGKQRLPGFRGEWETKRLGEIGEVASAGIDKKIRPDQVPVRLVNYLDVYKRDFIFSKDLSHLVTATQVQASRCQVRKGDVFFTPSSEVRDDIAHSAVAMENIQDAVYSYHVVRLRVSDDWDLRFRAYAFKTKAFFDQAHVLCDGSGTRYVISQGKFRAMTVLVPPIPEQAAIAAVLSDMDAEIDALTQRRDKTRAVKQGMMQELLTGRTRLV